MSEAVRADGLTPCWSECGCGGQDAAVRCTALYRCSRCSDNEPDFSGPWPHPCGCFYDDAHQHDATLDPARLRDAIRTVLDPNDPGEWQIGILMANLDKVAEFYADPEP